MKGDQTCPNAEQAVGLALHALEPADEDVLTAHVPQCPICQELVRQTQDVIWGLAAESEQQDPPARVRAGLMSEVASTSQLPPQQREQPWSSDEPDVPSPARAPSPERWGAVPPSSEARPSSRHGTFGRSERASRRLRFIALVATMVVAFVGIAGGVIVEVMGGAGQQQSAALSQPSPEVNRILADLDRAGARPAVLRSPDGKVAAAVAQFPSGRQVMPIRLAANAADRTMYVLWGLHDQVPTAIGTFDVGAPSETMLPVVPVGNAGQYTSYAISIEKGRAVPGSPGPVVASGQVAS